MIEILRKINKKRKDKKRMEAGKYLSPVRRIERVYPPSDRRVVAMTFDDGPSALPPNPKPKGCTDPSLGLTEHILNILDKYDAVGTFDVIGDTSENYPDKKGKDHTANWGGLKYDHYPDYTLDHLAGAKNQPEILKKIASNHCISNHTYRHILFGPVGALKMIYGKRVHFQTISEVVDDVLKLNNLLHKNFSEQILESKFKRFVGSNGIDLGRPPHYVDNIIDGTTAYDAYAYLGLNYMAASFDGGGWKATSGNYDQDVQAMIEPIKMALEEDPDSLNGQIIFQKDGVNMSRQTPIADALEPQLKLLTQYDYEIIGVDELIWEYPFEDLDDNNPAFHAARELDHAGYICAYKNNTFQPDRILTFGELVAMVTPKQVFSARIEFITKTKEYTVDGSANPFAEKIQEIINTPVNLSEDHPYWLCFKFAKYCGYLEDFEDIDVDTEVTPEILYKFLEEVYFIIKKTWEEEEDNEEEEEEEEDFSIPPEFIENESTSPLTRGFAAQVIADYLVYEENDIC